MVAVQQPCIDGALSHWQVISVRQGQSWDKVIVSLHFVALLQDDDSSSRTSSDDWNYRRPRQSYPGNGRGRWNDSIPNNIILMRGLPEEVVETDVCMLCLRYIK